MVTSVGTICLNDISVILPICLWSLTSPQYFNVYSLCSVVSSCCFQRFATDCKVTILAEGPIGLAPRVMVKMERST